MLWMFEYVVLLLKILVKFEHPEQLDTSELVLVNVVFRHGERNPVTFYPTDPNKNKFKPDELGAITNRGKLTASQLGKVLRMEYKHTLQNSLSQEIEMRSTHFSRTITSAQLVLKELWSETKDKVGEELDWSTIPIYSKPIADEDLLKPDECPRRKTITNSLSKDPNLYDKYLKEHEYILNYIIENSGWPIDEIFTLMVFYEVLKSEDGCGLALPEWTKNVYPMPLSRAIARCFEYRNEGIELKRINAGYLLRKWLKNAERNIRNESSTKMYLYSAHDTSIGFLQDVLGTPEAHLPTCGSALIMEVRRKDANYFLKVRYVRDPWTEEIEELKIPNCETLCPVERFRSLYTNFLPFVSYKEACKDIST